VNLADFNQLAGQIAVSAEQLRVLLQQIAVYIPASTVWAFGSRIKGTCLPASDLDLAVHCNKESARNILPKLAHILEESDLPFKVQLLDFNRLPANMQDNIKANYVEIYHG
jgi:predicted nucleotidyltransferase